MSNSAFSKWDTVTKTLLMRTLGPTHHTTQAFSQLVWIHHSNPAQDRLAFDQARERARGLLDGAVSEIELLTEPAPAVDDAMFDAELWEHVSVEVRSEAWGKAAREAVIFTEDRIRRWAGRPDAEISTRLAVTVFGEAGEYRLGREPSEKQGWQNLTSGLMGAIRNVDAHRLQERPDHKRYALGVIGTCSLLLTQMRYEHGNRFHDVTPVPVDLTIHAGDL